MSNVGCRGEKKMNDNGIEYIIMGISIGIPLGWIIAMWWFYG